MEYPRLSDLGEGHPQRTTGPIGSLHFNHPEPPRPARVIVDRRRSSTPRDRRREPSLTAKWLVGKWLIISEM